MKTGWVVLAIALSWHAPAAAQERDLERTIAGLEQQRTRAMVDADKSYLNHILAEDVTYAHSTGLVQTKQELIAAIETGRIDYVSIDEEKTVVRVYGETAVVTGVSVFVVSVGDERLTVRLSYTDVYAKRDGYWQMVAYQSTRIPDKAEE